MKVEVSSGNNSETHYNMKSGGPVPQPPDSNAPESAIKSFAL